MTILLYKEALGKIYLRGLLERLLTGSPFMRMTYGKRRYNRLLERGETTRGKTIKMDARSRLVAETVLRSGYANVGEMFIDLLYKEANRINPSMCLPMVSGLKEKEDELSRQLIELQALISQQRSII